MPAEADPVLAALSDQLILVTVLLYVLAMLAYALDLAFGRDRAETSTAPAEPVLAAVGGTAATAAQQGEDGAAVRSGADEVPETAASGAGEDTGGTGPAPKPLPAWVTRAGTAALVLSWLGLATNLGALVTRGLAAGRWPWGNMYEFVIAICMAAMAAFLLMQLRYPVRFLGATVSAAAALGLGAAVHSLQVEAGPAMVALNSYWIAIHVSAAIAASGLFIVAGACGVIYLIRNDAAVHLPTREELERVAHRAIVIGFPIWTFAVIAGALWADKAWGRYWGWDPKEIWAFITWIVYAGYLHARATAGWKGRSATIVQLVAFGCLLFNLIGVNIFIPGLHSYAELPGQ
ncbi:c-type cytochrome biogenesis protein CcsB [Planobispora rosea]|uniref:C-type cytochrome biogenesis protein CcsB n=1 Tax=Planobispora rosea TaxID=35762 RepID=A0A8J3RZK6_PLARO|nr:c-type cytochrome biogenesis protein CcsB [Planobispora rosea]GGS82423.1 c-type cytochrome biogenesis protein CcsB [Planobispora rosea]GIH84248.1 c-type cytochrome biogenesis protein CcsB [Planobispora rosea]